MEYGGAVRRVRSCFLDPGLAAEKVKEMGDLVEKVDGILFMLSVKW